MNISQIMDHIHQIEKTIPAQDWSYKGIDLWPALRSKLYFDLFLKYHFPSVAENAKAPTEIFSFIKKFVRALPSFFKAIYALLFCAKRDVVFLADPSYTFLKGKYYQRFIDPEIECLSEHKTSSITISTMADAPNPTTHPTLQLFTVDIIIRITSALYSRAFPNTTHLIKLDDYNDAIEKLRLERISNRSATSLAVKHFLASKLYQIILRRISPKAAFVVSYYESLNMAFVHACKALQIPIIDIQHGTINNFHACYGGWPNIPANGFNTLPDYFSCWDERSAGCINAWARHTNGKHSAITHGNRFMQKVLSQPNLFEPHFQDVQTSKSPQKNILLTLQTFYELTPFLEEMLKISPQDYFWWIRFHPMLSEEDVNKIKTSLSSITDLQYETEQSTAHSLYAVLPLMDSHVTLNSSVVIEASQIGVPSIVCEETGYSYYAAEFENGDAYKALTPREVIDIIQRVKKSETAAKFPPAMDLYKQLNVIQ